MSFLDKVGKKALDAIDSAARAAERVQERALPLLDKTPLGAKLRDLRRAHDTTGVPTPEQNVSPFTPPPTETAKKPLGKPELPAQVFGRGTDPWTGRALQLFVDREIEHEFVDLEAEGGAQLEAQLMNETKQPNPPYIYLRGEHAGGFNALSEMDRLGQLEEMVKPPEERGQTRGRTRIVIGKRGGDEAVPGERGNPDDRQ